MNQRRIGLWRPTDIIAKAFGGGASGWIEKDDLSDFVAPSLRFCPIPRCQRLTCRAGREQQYARALFSNTFLEFLQIELLLGLLFNLLTAFLDDLSINLIRFD